MTKIDYHGLLPLYNIGKNGVSDTILSEISKALKARKVVKIKILKSAEGNIKDIASSLVKIPTPFVLF